MEYILLRGRREDLPHAYDIRACGNDFRGPWIIQVGHVVSSPPVPVSFRSGVRKLAQNKESLFRRSIKTSSIFQMSTDATTRNLFNKGQMQSQLVLSLIFIFIFF